MAKLNYDSCKVWGKLAPSLSYRKTYEIWVELPHTLKGWEISLFLKSGIRSFMKEGVLSSSMKVAWMEIFLTKFVAISLIA